MLAAILSVEPPPLFCGQRHDGQQQIGFVVSQSQIKSLVQRRGRNDDARSAQAKDDDVLYVPSFVQT